LAVFSKCNDLLMFLSQVGDSYQELLEKMDGSQMATMARVIMINPLDRRLPQFVIHIQVRVFIKMSSNVL